MRVAKKTRYRLDFIRENRNMHKSEIAKKLNMDTSSITRFAKAHGIILKSGRDLLEDYIKTHRDLCAYEIVLAVKKETGREYEVNYITTLARELEIKLPHSRVRKRIILGTPLKTRKRKPAPAPVPKFTRPPAEYNNTRYEYKFLKL